ncbi:MAG: tetratricopeptide repeat protein [Pseudomonadota bacterium]
MRRSAVLFAAVLATFAAPAAASVLVVGTGMAADCSKAAFAGRGDRDSILLCTRSLQEERLLKRDRAGTHVNRGVMLLRSKDYAAAREDFDRAIALEPALGEAFVNRGVAMMADQDYDAALADIDKGIALGVDEPAKAFYNRGLVHESLGDARAAFLDYRKAQELAPDWPAPARQLTRFSVTRD